MGSRDVYGSLHRDADLLSRQASLCTDNPSRDDHLRNDRNKPDNSFIKYGLDDQQRARSKKSMGNYQHGRFDSSGIGYLQASSRSSLYSLDYGREKERRISVLYEQDPFMDDERGSKPGQSFMLESIVGFSTLEAKTAKKKKEETLDFCDPVRELFEAELENVQKMQEQERQRLAEEQERAIELARKEEEERERLAREEELLRLKLEEEAREAAAQAQREQEEAARKVEEIRRSREAEKRAAILEEERRKEAAKRKLLELEQRIALRESGGSFNRDEEHRLGRQTQSMQNPVRREHVAASSLMPAEYTERNYVDSHMGDVLLGSRNRMVQVNQRSLRDDEQGPLPSKKSHQHRDISWRELEQRGFSRQESVMGPTSPFSRGASQSPSTEQEHVSQLKKESLQIGNERKTNYPLTDIHTNYVNSENERDSDTWWGTDDSQGHLMNSPPPLFPYVDRAENDYPSMGRLRQSLPKQPRVPPPIFGRSNAEKQIIPSQPSQAISPEYDKSCSDDKSRVGDNIDTNESTLNKNSEEDDSGNIKTLRGCKEIKSPNDNTTEMLDGTLGDFRDGSGAYGDENPPADEIDELSDQLSDLTESEHSNEEDKQFTIDTQVNLVATYTDEDDGWPVQESLDTNKERFDEEEETGEVAQDEFEEQEWEKSETLESARSVLQHEDEELENSTWESQNIDDKSGDSIEDGSDGYINSCAGAADSEWVDSQSFEPQVAQGEVENVDPQGILKSGSLESQNILSYANNLDHSQMGQSEGHTRMQSFVQQFQQPFSFMAVPLPQSTTVNGVPLHPPMLSPLHSLQSYQELPYHLQMGLFPSAPLMPNAIQIGSIQMPLQVHPQILPTAHQHQQPPVLQFGQLCQLSQPVPSIQPAFQMHHTFGQPLLAQPKVDFLSQENPQVHQLEQAKDHVKLVGEAPINFYAIPTPAIDCRAETLIGEQMHGMSGEIFVSASETIPPVKVDIDVSCTVRADTRFCKQDSKVGKPTGGRRGNHDVQSNGAHERGRIKSSTVKDDDLNGPYSVSENVSEISAKEASPKKTHQQNLHKTEYKVQRSLQSSDEGSKQYNDQKHFNHSYIGSNNVCDGHARAQKFPFDNALGLRFYTQGFEEVSSELSKAVPSIQFTQPLMKSIESDDVPSRVRNASVDNQQMQMSSRKVKAHELDIVLESKLGLPPKQQESQVLNNSEIHVEIQSHKEQQELHDATHLEELKVKDQIARKQTKIVGKSALHGDFSVKASDQNPAEKWSILKKEHGVQHTQMGAVIGSNMEQFCACSNSVGLSTPAINESQGFQSVQYHPSAGVMHLKEHIFNHHYCKDTSSLNAAWGVAKSPHEVVSLAQMQLEEAMKPFGYDAMPSQITPISDRGPAIIEPRISFMSSSLDDISVTRRVSSSIPGPISSLLAGEKIQFGAVTSPTVSSSSRPPSPFIGSSGSHFGYDKPESFSHAESNARNHAKQDNNDTSLSNKATTKDEDGLNGHNVDAEAEAMAAASAIAVAAISNDDVGNDVSDANSAVGGGTIRPYGSFSTPSGTGIIQAPNKKLGVDNSVPVALPADLSEDTSGGPSKLLTPNISNTSEIMLEHSASRSSFPGFELNTFFGRPIVTYCPQEDVISSSFDSGLAGLGGARITGWQNRLPSTSDILGAPASFMSPGGLPGIQGQPHMLLYANPFTPVGQFGQLGVSVMGAAYHPSGKHPDWSHTPYPMPSASLSQSCGECNPGRHPIGFDAQHHATASNATIMSTPAQMNAFDHNFASSFQAHWSGAPMPPFPNYQISAPASGLNLQPRPNEAQSIHSHVDFQQPARMSGLCSARDVAALAASDACFYDQIGLEHSGTSNNPMSNDEGMLVNGVDAADRAEVSCGRLQQGLNMPLNASLVPASSKHDMYLNSQNINSSALEGLSVQSKKLNHQESCSSHCSNASLMISENRSSWGRQDTVCSVSDWQGSNQWRDSSHTVPADRGTVTSSGKLKQIYVAKPSTQTRLMDAA
ncbi:hypothetical protein KP509_27G046700 [Ceratopteris richardii]|nr:hypothetical protein KP509_27G046700 [Ceratopteris richardii]